MPVVPVDRATIEAIFAPITDGEPLGAVVPVSGGLINTLFRVTTGTGDEYALRVYSGTADGSSAVTRMVRERALLDRLTGVVPVPQPVIAEASGTPCEQPFMIYRWAEGVTLNKCRRDYGPNALLSLAASLGGVLATIASVDVPEEPALRHLDIADALAKTDDRLAASLARDRLGPATADALRSTLAANHATLSSLDETTALVHGDFGGRNIIVRSVVADAWEVSSVLDWEMASTGSPLWDVGSLFRSAARYSPEFRHELERGYRGAGGVLPDEWWRRARLIDMTRLIAILSVERELPDVFDECREVVGGLI